MTHIIEVPYPRKEQDQLNKRQSGEWLDERIAALELVELEVSYSTPFVMWDKSMFRPVMPFDKQALRAEHNARGVPIDVDGFEKLKFTFNDKATALLFKLTHGGA